MTDSTITVLHVEDDEEMAELVQEYIQHRHDDLTIRTARNGDVALSHLETTDDVDCVVSDYQMPEVNGLDLLAAIRDHWPDLPFILFTGRGGEEIAMRAITAGVTDYLQKQAGTSQYEVLVNRVRNAVARHRAETELKQAAQRTEAQFELLVDTVEDYAIFFLDEDGYIQTWNTGAENIKGYTSEEIIGEHFSVFYPEADMAAGVPDQNLRKAATAGRIADEGWRVRKDGSEFWADVRIVALREAGELVGYAKVTRDSTQRHREQVLLDQKEQLERLIAAISHDLRNPLSVVEGNIELTRETGDLSRLDAAEEGLDRATELLDYLGRLATEGERILEPESVGLREVAEAAWAVIETEGADLTIDGSMEFTADRQRLQQLFENLFRNAVTHASPDATISVGLLTAGGFYVEDDGPGIPEENREQVFEYGYTTHDDGMGHGLSIVRSIAGGHGWDIVATDAEDGGARFEITGIEFVGNP